MRRTGDLLYGDSDLLGVYLPLEYDLLNGERLPRGLLDRDLLIGDLFLDHDLDLEYDLRLIGDLDNDLYLFLGDKDLGVLDRLGE